MTHDTARTFVGEWIAAWSSQGLDRVRSHYAPEIELLSRFAQKLVGSGRISGLPASLRSFACYG